MSNNVLPNLSEWFEVPVGAEIPAHTLYALSYSDGSHLTAKDSSPFRVAEAGRFFTEKPIEVVKETLEDVIRAAGTSITDIARAVEAFYAEQKPEQPRVIIDDQGSEGEWRLNAEGTYDFWYGDEYPSDMLVSYTRERIEKFYGIKEERY